MAYATREDIEAIYGPANLAKWADIDADQDAAKIAARIAAAIAYADDAIDLRLRGGQYVIPLVTAAGATPLTITNLSARLAGLWLYESRGIEDTDPDGNPVHRLAWHRKDAGEVLGGIASGTLRLNAVTTSSMPEAPMVF